MKRKRISKDPEKLTELLIDPSAPIVISESKKSENKKLNDFPKPSPFSIK